MASASPRRSAATRLALLLGSLVATAGVSQAAELQLAYTVDVLRNARGGAHTGADVLGMAELMLDGVPLEHGARTLAAHLHLQYTHGGGFSEQRVGDLQTVSNIDAPTGGRIMEAWLERSWGEEFALKAGLYDLNSELDALDAGALFIGSSHGIGPDFSQSGANGPSIFPTTSLALRARWHHDSGLSVQAAVLDAVPGDPDHPGRTRINLGDGVLSVLEADLDRSRLRAGLGAWRYSRPVAALQANDGAHDDYEQGLYAFVEGAPWPHGETATASRWSSRGIRGFLRVGFANAKVEQLDAYVGAGMVLEGMLLPRHDNSLGLAVAYARNGREWRRLQRQLGTPAASSETAFELTWQLAVSERFTLQPDVQYVLNPGGTAALNDALVIGLRLTVTQH